MIDKKLIKQVILTLVSLAAISACAVYAYKLVFLVPPVIDTEHTKKIKLSDLDTSKAQLAQQGIHYVHGNQGTELPEQQLISEFVGADDYILELGTNVGLSTMMAAHSLHNSANIVTSESNAVDRLKAIENRDANAFQYTVVPAISNEPLVQKAWATRPVPKLRKLGPDWEKVETITLLHIKNQTKINKFDTLILDCEGCGNIVLKENPELLSNAKVIIYEHDEPKKKMYVDIIKMLKRNGFQRAVCVKAPKGHGSQKWENECFYAVYLRE